MVGNNYAYGPSCHVLTNSVNHLSKRPHGATLEQNVSGNAATLFRRLSGLMARAIPCAFRVSNCHTIRLLINGLNRQPLQNLCPDVIRYDIRPTMDHGSPIGRLLCDPYVKRITTVYRNFVPF